jgi:hypothetical protein
MYCVLEESEVWRELLKCGAELQDPLEFKWLTPILPDISSNK